MNHPDLGSNGNAAADLEAQRAAADNNTDGTPVVPDTSGDTPPAADSTAVVDGGAAVVTETPVA